MIKLTFSFLIFLVIGLGGQVLGQATSADELSFPDLPEFEVPAPKRIELDNGMVVMLLEDHELPLVHVVARIRTGARYEPSDKVGLAGLAGLVMRTGGTQAMGSDELDDFLEGRAANVTSSISGGYGSASMSCLRADFPEVFLVFRDMLREPEFDERRLGVAVNQLRAGISRQNDDPMEILSREFDELVYGRESPYARVPTFATLGSIARSDLISWHGRYYHPNNVILGLIGDFDTDKALRMVESAFGDWAQGTVDETAGVFYAGEAKPGVYYVEKNDMTQSNIKIGHLGIRRDDPDYFAVEVLNQVFSGSSSSRLYSSVRSEKGLAYAVVGGVRSDWDHPGTFNMWITTKTETTGEGIEALVEEAHNLVARPPSKEEVQKAKKSILNSFIFNVDSRAEVLSQQLTFEYYGFPLDWLTLYRDGIENVTLEQVQATAKKHIHPEQFVILVVGPKEGLDRPLTDFGTVTAVDTSIPAP